MITYPGITVIEGNLGCGKTLASVIIALYYNRVLNRDVYSNFEIRDIDYNPITCLNDLEHVRRGLLILDESYTVLRAREFMSNKNKAINTIIQHSRKKDFHVIMISQRFHMIDKDMRALTNRIISPKITKYDNGKPIQAHWKYYAPTYATIDSAPTWTHIKTAKIEIHPWQLDSYSTNADIHDFSLERFKKGIKDANKREHAMADWIKKQPEYPMLCDSVETNGHFPRGIDVTVYRKDGRVIEIDEKKLAMDGRILLRENKTPKKMEGKILAYLSGQEYKGILLDEEMIKKLPDKRHIPTKAVKEHSRFLKSLIFN